MLSKQHILLLLCARHLVVSSSRRCRCRCRKCVQHHPLFATRARRGTCLLRARSRDLTGRMTRVEGLALVESRKMLVWDARCEGHVDGW